MISTTLQQILVRLYIFRSDWYVRILEMETLVPGAMSWRSFASVCGRRSDARQWTLFCITVAAFLLVPGHLFGQPDVTRMLFTPPVVPETQTDPVRFEATVTGGPSSVAYNYSGTDRPMFDDGTHGDLAAGDGI